MPSFTNGRVIPRCLPALVPVPVPAPRESRLWTVGLRWAAWCLGTSPRVLGVETRLGLAFWSASSTTSVRPVNRCEPWLTSWCSSTTRYRHTPYPCVIMGQGRACRAGCHRVSPSVTKCVVVYCGWVYSSVVLSSGAAGARSPPSYRPVRR